MDFASVRQWHKGLLPPGTECAPGSASGDASYT
jgi:hypothetical protein